MTTSWDCFDTLVARRKLDPLSVFYDIGEKHGLNNFTARRKAAESRAPWTLDSIYEELAKDFGWDETQREKYKQVEIDAEIEHCCPVNENMRLVQDGDLIVSDMYLPEWAVRQILEKNGLRKKVDITVTTGGKHSGTIWQDLPFINLHVGDNYHSDVVSPRAAGIEARHFTGTQMTPIEMQVGGDLALLMRAVRLANPYEPQTVIHAMWHEQAELNVPALVLAGLELPAENLAFVMRDCVHLQPIHEALWGTKNNTFHSSRIALKSGGEAFVSHVRDTAYGRTIVDLQGSGKSVMDYWGQTFGEEPELLYVNGHMCVGRALVENNHDALERFNSSPLGSLAHYPDRLPCEFEPAVLECQAQAIACAIEHIPYFNFTPNPPLLKAITDAMLDTVTMRYNVHVVNHEID